MEPIHTPFADPSGTGAKYQVDETQSTRLRYWSLTKNKGKTSSEVEPDNEPLKLQTYADIQAFLLSDDELDKYNDEEEPEPSHVQESASDSSNPDLKRFDNILPLIDNILRKLENLLSLESTKALVIRVYRGTDGRNFEVHEPFLFSAFGIFELDELREIIRKKKNAVVKDLMNSLSRRYKRLKKIPEELEIHSALPAPAPEQASSRSSRRKRKHVELELETRIPGLECNRALPENVPFTNNMVIEEPCHTPK
ncbi:hypothetical protein Tco_0216809 [Tanacetum coccineum]